MSYRKNLRVLFESRDSVLTISDTENYLFVSANVENLISTKAYPKVSHWSDACEPKELLSQVEELLGSSYVQELQERHEEFLDDLISYWEE